jgi:hypothetical protein
MADKYKDEKDVSDRDRFFKAEKEILKNKLKLDEEVVGLLLTSKGSIKSKSFFKKVTEQIRRS